MRMILINHLCLSRCFFGQYLPEDMHKTTKTLRRASALGLALTCATAELRAEEIAADATTSQDLVPYVVVATRTPLTLDRVSPSVSYISAEEMEFWQDRTLTDVLKRETGVTIRSNGAYGAVSSVFTRGTNSNHTSYFLDGRRLPIAFSGQFNAESIGLNNLESVQFQKGASTVNYGSSGIGGVLDLQSKRVLGEDVNSVSLETEVGSNDSYRGAVSTLVSNENWAMSLGVSAFNTDNERDNDSAEEHSLHSRFDYLLADDLTFELLGQYTEVEKDVPGSAGFPSPEAWTENQYWMLSPGLCYVTDEMNMHLFYARSVSKLEGKGPLSVTDDEINSDEISLQVDYTIFDALLLTSGALYRNDELKRNSTGYSNNVSQFGGFLQAVWQLNERIELRAGVRGDNYSDYDESLSGNFEVIYNILEWNASVFAKVSNSYAPPRPNDLAYDYDTSTPINPEEGVSYDFGYRQQLLEGQLEWSAVYFYNAINDLIDFNYLGFIDGDYRYDVYNITEAETQGVELSLDYTPVGYMSFGAGYTYLDTEDKNAGRRLLRRPRHTVQVSTSIDFSDAIRVGLSGTGYHDSPDAGGKGDDYFLVDCVVNWQITKDLSLFGRVDNLFDKKYNVVGVGDSAYPALGRAAYVGARLSF
jgi:vitamin B12 transporter